MTAPHTIHAHVPSVPVGEFAPKPTALTQGMVEADAELWEHAGDSAGVWECSPGTFAAVRDGYAELCQIVSGRVTIEVDGAVPVELGPGSALIMPDGWKGTWVVHEQLRKLYVIIPTR